MSKNATTDISIIIPTYNEAVLVDKQPRIKHNLHLLSNYMQNHAHGASYEIIVVDADSPDGTSAVVKSILKTIAHLKLVSAGPKPAGEFIKGKQVALGFAKASGEYVMFMDADLATPLSHMQEVFGLMKANHPVGIGVRNLSQSHKGIRKFVSNFGNILVRVVLTPGVRDTQCGFKVFRSDAAKTIFSQQRVISWGFDMEAIALAKRYNYDITLIDVPDWHDIVQGSKIGGNSALKAAMQVLPDLVRIKWGLWTGKYKSAKEVSA